MGEELIYKKLSYVVNGIFYKVQNELGTKFQEKHYVRAVASLLKANKIPFELEVPIKITFNGEFLGNFRADMLIDNKILIEFKTVPFLNMEHKKQIIRYLKATNIKLALLVNFRKYPLEVIRLVN